MAFIVDFCEVILVYLHCHFIPGPVPGQPREDMKSYENIRLRGSPIQVSSAEVSLGDISGGT